MSIEHTPGPWEALTDRRNAKGHELPPVVIYAGEAAWPRKGAPLATVNVSDSVHRFGNARLIAAAPELLATLKAIIGVLPENWGNVVSEGMLPAFHLLAEDVDNALKAIAKAEGR